MPTATPTLRVGIAGITGKFARLLTKHLLSSPGIHVRGLARTPSRLAQLDSTLATHSRLELVQGEAFSEPALRSFLRGLDVVVCCYLGDNHLMTAGQRLLIDLAEEAGVERYVASDWSLDYTRLEEGQLPSKDPMREVKNYLDGKKAIRGVHVLNAAFMEVLVAPMIGLLDHKGRKVRCWGDGTRRWIEGTTYDDAAAFTAGVVRDRGAVGVHRVLGGAVTPKEFAEVLGKVYGGIFELECLGSLDELYDKMDLIRSRDPSNTFAYMGLNYTYYMASGQTLLGEENVENAKYLTVKAKSFKDFFREHKYETLPQVYDRV